MSNWKHCKLGIRSGKRERKIYSTSSATISNIHFLPRALFAAFRCVFSFFLISWVDCSSPGSWDGQDNHRPLIFTMKIMYYLIMYERESIKHALSDRARRKKAEETISSRDSSVKLCFMEIFILLVCDFHLWLLRARWLFTNVDGERHYGCNKETVAKIEMISFEYDGFWIFGVSSEIASRQNNYIWFLGKL